MFKYEIKLSVSFNNVTVHLPGKRGRKRTNTNNFEMIVVIFEIIVIIFEMIVIIFEMMIIIF